MAELCVTIARKRHSKLLEEMEEAGAAGVRLIELRLDYLQQEPRFRDILARRPCPLVATLRRREDGGLWRGDEERRQQLLRGAIAAGFDYVDLEEDIAPAIPRFGATKRIISLHDFQGMPEDLLDLARAMRAKDADIVKIAARSNDPDDNFRMFDLLRQSESPTVAFCMGDLGTPSRILGAKFGAPFTYAAFNPLRIVAPGLLTFREMRSVYHYESINANTEIYGVIGNPIAQSLSPLVHNLCFRERGLNKVYVPFRVPEECLDRFLRRSAEAGIRGLSVTIPHKQAILRHGRVADDLVRQTGSANTMLRRDGGPWELANTDGPAATMALEEALGEVGASPSVLRDRTVLVLGAGGVARTIVHSLVNEGAIVTIANRSVERAHDLARDANCLFIEWGSRHTQHFDILINCTKVGMYPEMDASPFHAGSITEGMVVFDTVYNPENTLLLREAKARGAKIVTGAQMFVRQAEAQFRLFTGIEPPEGRMLELVREELSPARRMLREARDQGRERLKNIYLVGYRGTGKSTIGPLLAERLDRAFLDLDEAIEQREGKTIAEIFALLGEPAFRTLEEKVLTEIGNQLGMVVACGGGAVLRERNRQTLERGWVVWLRAEPERIHQRLLSDATTSSRRPSLTNRDALEEIRVLVAERQRFYEEAADWSISTDHRTPEDLAADIARQWAQEGQAELEKP